VPWRYGRRINRMVGGAEIEEFLNKLRHIAAIGVYTEQSRQVSKDSTSSTQPPLR